MKKTIQKYLRKKKHIKYVDLYLSDTRWEIVNTVIAASATEYSPAVTNHLDNLGQLVRKYERRRHWLKF